MKEGVWGIGLIIISLITFAVVGTISNVTTTYQQDYEFMKSSVEAAMYDARDEIKYRRGICLCTSKKSSDGSVIKFLDSTDYKILRPNDESECDGMLKGSEAFQPSECKYLHGEWIVNPDIFTESLISRFGTVAKNQETYDITVQDVIEYPPKTSVRVTYYQYLFEAMGNDNAAINTQMDAIFEGKDKDISEPSGKGTVLVGIKDCNFKTVSGTVKVKKVATGATISVKVPGGCADTKCFGKVTDAKFLKPGAYILIYGEKEVPYNIDPNDLNKTISIYAWKTDLKDCPCKDPENPPEETTEEDPDKATVTTHHYVENSTTKVHADDKQSIEVGKTYSTKYYASSDLESSYNDYEWNGTTPSNASGTITKKNNIEVIYYYKKKQSPSQSFSEKCKWHYDGGTKKCKSNKATGKDQFGVDTYDYKEVTITGATGKDSCGIAYQNCVNAVNAKCPTGYSYSTGCSGIQTYSITYKTGATASKSKTCYNSGGKYNPPTMCDSKTMSKCSCQG